MELYNFNLYVHESPIGRKRIQFIMSLLEVEPKWFSSVSEVYIQNYDAMTGDTKKFEPDFFARNEPFKDEEIISIYSCKDDFTRKRNVLGLNEVGGGAVYVVSVPVAEINKSSVNDIVRYIARMYELGLHESDCVVVAGPEVEIDAANIKDICIESSSNTSMASWIACDKKYSVYVGDEYAEYAVIQNFVIFRK